ncbi:MULTISPECIES: hypothetical protein [Uliginosibacterium]|uniref:Uncharacterized protein n=1 Tax=Uliginosibacterium aquaticum TaxID=2731212 RepID=A0ABX2IB97_9RHOO|nr:MULTISPECIES: hypothetical protein [Uliginosibacterium]MDO6386245.1 hypothetical protein [Uliginosibacterium sp. 31-12]NSL53571.1 hypothetical protein [Uliginosibacterium aquaticum]PLK49310.1 hypothetical protein C0V76_08935 [Uliginosibacterium sp. TH139]
MSAMFDIAIYSKTALGRAEMNERRLGLSQRLRRALIMVDGKTRYGILREMLEPLGEPKEVIEQLVELGLIESDYDLPPMPVFGNMLVEDPSTLMDVHPTR